jgi:hypothetical protein
MDGERWKRGGHIYPVLKSTCIIICMTLRFTTLHPHPLSPEGCGHSLTVQTDLEVSTVGRMEFCLRLGIRTRAIAHISAIVSTD